MPHISRKYLKKSDFEEIGKRLVETLAEITNTSKGRGFLQEFFTYTERIMLAKRLSVIFMLSQGATTYEIENTLKMSPSTVARMQLDFEVERFANVTKHFKSKKRRDRFWNDLEILLRAGLPPRGRGRWQWLFNKK